MYEAVWIRKSNVTNWKLSINLRISPPWHSYFFVLSLSHSVNIYLCEIWWTILAEAVVGKEKNGCHLKNISQIIFHVYIYDCICALFARYVVSMMKRLVVHRHQNWHRRWWCRMSQKKIFLKIQNFMYIHRILLYVPHSVFCQIYIFLFCAKMLPHPCQLKTSTYKYFKIFT